VKFGAEPKKVAILGGLLVVAAVALYMNMSDDTPAGPRPVSSPAASAQPTPRVNLPGPAASRHRTATRNSVSEFKPVLGSRNPEDRPDPTTIDPTLRLDLLAKVQSVVPGPPGRNVFQFGAAPPPPALNISIPQNVPKIATSNRDANAPPAPTGPPPVPTAPPMTFKYYGFQVSKSDGHKAAFLRDGEESLIAGENDTVKRRYKVVKIGINSITIEDTQFKSTQTLQLQENLGV
jgi:hypothetical protein